MQLNPQQEMVASHVYGRMLALAGPGSGKTRTLTERTARLIRQGIDPGSILCITFTNKARDEMRERIAKACGPAANRVTISNFHGLCGVILRRLGAPLGYSPRMTVLDDGDQVDLILQIARRKGLEPTKPQARVLAWVANEWRENLGEDDASLLEVAGDRVRDGELSIIKDYVRTLRQRNQVDFSSLLTETVRLLRDHADIRGRLQARFRFIQVDEYQDTNRAQNELVELLAGEEDNVLAVGDADQSIYEWRGASPDGIPRFIANGERKTGSCKIVKLGVNYRSTRQVIEVADRLIRHCKGRINVEFTAARGDGEPVRCVKFVKPEDEAEGVAENIRNMMRSGTQPRDMAVFYRTNDMSRLIEQALAKRQIPYTVIGAGSYYERMEVKDVLSMLRFVCNPRDGISFHRIANKPARGMGDALIGRLEAWAEQHGMDLLLVMRSPEQVRDELGRPLSDAAMRACRQAHDIFALPLARMSIAEVASALVQRTQYDQWLRDRYEEKGEYEDRRRNVDELLNSIAQFVQHNPRANIADYLQSISLYTDADEQRTGNAVRLMSLHASKGLEFDVVYMIGLEQGILPHDKAVKDRGDRGLDEERRLCYVGFTRAKKLLRVTWCEQRAGNYARSRQAGYVASRPSQFLLESGLMSEEEYRAAIPVAPPRGRAKRARATTGTTKRS